MKAHCCKIGCERPAEYEVRVVGGSVEDEAHACLEHIPDLMTDAVVHEVVKMTD